ncbi:MAG: adenylate/guanylate cyclase domain-containing protein [Geminicoccaceae bacterium]
MAKQLTAASNFKTIVVRVKQLLLGPDDPEHVPERVQTSIREEQDRGEFLVTLFQFGAILFFAAFYTLTPKAFPADVPFEPVPIALSVYAVFTLVRLYLVLRHRLPGWFITISVVVDITVLMITIWSFHIQYDAPASIYLKAPTLMYAFILIALRALRYDWRYVALAGIVTGIGWIVLVVYAATEEDMRVTRDYREYMTSYKVLLGAEIDKIISFMMVTLVLILVLIRARKLLLRATTDQAAAAELSRFFAPEVAGLIRDRDTDLKPGDAETCAAAIMFIDLRGFTPLTENMPPSEVMTLLGDYQSRMVAVVRDSNGSIDKFMGDGILASFGVVQPSDSYAADALGAMEHVVRCARDWSEERQAQGAEPIKIGVAVAVGEEMFGVVGGENRLEYTVIGDTVNLAAKLEKHAKVEAAEALTTNRAYDLARSQGFVQSLHVEMRSQREVGGVNHPLDLVIVG